MHSREYLSRDDFAFTRDGRSLGPEGVLEPWSPRDRVAFVAPDPVADLPRLAGPVLAWTQRFYDREIARENGFFDYPRHLLVGGEPGAAPRVLGPATSAGWSAAWCRLDIWPATHHVVADPDPATLMAAVLMLEPDVLVWPARVTPPASMALPSGPDETVARLLLAARLHSVWLYDDAPDGGGEGWSLTIGGGAAALAGEAMALVGDSFAGRSAYLVKARRSAFVSGG